MARTWIKFKKKKLKSSKLHFTVSAECYIFILLFFKGGGGEGLKRQITTWHSIITNEFSMDVRQNMLSVAVFGRGRWRLRLMFTFTHPWGSAYSRSDWHGVCHQQCPCVDVTVPTSWLCPCGQEHRLCIGLQSCFSFVLDVNTMKNVRKIVSGYVSLRSHVWWTQQKIVLVRRVGNSKNICRSFCGVSQTPPEDKMYVTQNQVDPCTYSCEKNNTTNNNASAFFSSLSSRWPLILFSVTIHNISMPLKVHFYCWSVPGDRPQLVH